MSVFKVRLPLQINWEEVEFTVGSVWGTNTNALTLWGWTGGAELSMSDAILEGSQYYIEVTCKNPDPAPNEQLAFIARYKLDGKQGVFCTMLV